jgi:hypothetical protein
MEELGEVVEGFGDTNETYSDLQDELMALAIEVLVLPCIEFRWEGRGEGGGWGADSNAMLCCLDSNVIVHACCLSLFLQFQHLDRRSRRGGSANKTKGNPDMSPRGRQSKRVKST